MNDWAAGITEFPIGSYTVRDSSGEDCPRCGAKAGYFCFETVTNYRGHVQTFPIRAHVVSLHESKYTDEIPVEHQALSSGRSRAGC